MGEKLRHKRGGERFWQRWQRLLANPPSVLDSEMVRRGESFRGWNEPWGKSSVRKLCQKGDKERAPLERYGTRQG